MKKKTPEDNRTAEVLTRITKEKILILYSSLSEWEKNRLDNRHTVYYKPTQHKFIGYSQ